MGHYKLIHQHLAEYSSGSYQKYGIFLSVCPHRKILMLNFYWNHLCTIKGTYSQEMSGPFIQVLPLDHI